MFFLQKAAASRMWWDRGHVNLHFGGFFGSWFWVEVFCIFSCLLSDFHTLKDRIYSAVSFFLMLTITDFFLLLAK